MSDTALPQGAQSIDGLLWPDDDHVTLHDAELLRLAIDYVSATAGLALSVCVGDANSADAAEREARRTGTLVIEGLRTFAIEPPAERRVARDGDGLWIDAELGEPTSAKEPGRQEDPASGVRFWIYVNDWNSFMRIECQEISFVWSDIGPAPPN